MGHEDQDDRDREVLRRIVSLMQATEQASKKKLSDEELQTLKTAAGRLDQMLKAAADADLQALRIAAARLDQLLLGIGAGKDVTPELKRRRDQRSSVE
jgi:hypothetical protein